MEPSISECSTIQKAFNLTCSIQSIAPGWKGVSRSVPDPSRHVAWILTQSSGAFGAGNVAGSAEYLSKYFPGRRLIFLRALLSQSTQRKMKPRQTVPVSLTCAFYRITEFGDFGHRRNAKLHWRIVRRRYSLGSIEACGDIPGATSPCLISTALRRRLFTIGNLPNPSASV